MAKSETLSGKEMLTEKKKFNVFDMIGGIFKPILIVIIGAGVLQALRDILVQVGAISRAVSYTHLDVYKRQKMVCYYPY